MEWMNAIPKGWKLSTLDASCIDSHHIKNKPSATVCLCRDSTGYAWWASLDDEGKDAVELYIYGKGKTVQEAFDNACKAAREATEAPRTNPLTA